MPRRRDDWMPLDEWADDGPDSDADPERDYCFACGRYASGPVCEGPGPYPRPCPMALAMPPQ